MPVGATEVANAYNNGYSVMTDDAVLILCVACNGVMYAIPWDNFFGK